MPVDELKKPRTFKDSLLWVHHDAATMEPGQSRREVFGHIQQKYRKWKRDQTTKAIRASVKLPRKQFTSPSESSDQKEHPLLSEQEGITPINLPYALNYQRLSAACKIQKQWDQDTTKGRGKTRGESCKYLNYPGPHSIVPFRGNSDPFNAYAININPVANYIILMIRKCILPSMYYTNEAKFQSLAAGMQDWYRCVGSLEDAGAGNALLSRYGSILASVTLDELVRQQVLASRAKSLEILRKKLETNITSSTEGSMNFYWHANMLFAAEILDGNYNAARVHASTLDALFRRDATKQCLHWESLFYAMYNDHHLSTMLLREPIIDPLKWPRSNFSLESLIGGISKQSYDVNHTEALNDEITEDADLTFLFVTMRQMLHVTKLQNKLSSVQKTTDDAWIRFRIWIFMQRKRIIRFYDQIRNRRIDGTLSDAIDRNQAHEYTALTLILITKATTSFSVMGIQIYDAVPQILSKLKLIFMDSERPRTHEAWKRYCYLRFWALYNAATIAIARGSGSMEFQSNANKADEIFFKTRLRNHAANMRKWNWDDAREILTQFLYMSALQPSGSEWYESVMAERSR